MDVVQVVKRNPLIFPMACIAVMAMIFISEGSYWRSADTLDRLGAMAVVPSSLQELQWGILDASTRSAHGLVGMRFRVEAEGGVLSIVAAAGLGTLVIAKLPEAAPQPQAATAAKSA